MKRFSQPGIVTMATIITKSTALNTGIQFDTFDVTGLFDFDSFSSSTAPASSFLRLFDFGFESTDYVEFAGTGFQFQTSNGAITDVLAGTVTSFTLRDANIDVIKLTGGSISAADLFDAAFAGNTTAFLALMFEGDDTIGGTGYGDTLLGFDGADVISGGGGGDIIIGGNGADTISGRTGNDTLTGGVGADKFVFDTQLNATTNKDTISGLSSIDRIVLDNDVFTGLGASFTASEFRSIDTGTSFASVDASDNIVYVKSTGQIFYDRDGSGTTYARVLFAELPDNTSLVLSQFLLVE
jgi:Ca2+-binding RTX toxin-like protein